MFSFFSVHHLDDTHCNNSSSDGNLMNRRKSIDTNINNASEQKSKKKNKNNDEIKIVQYRGIRSLFALRAARREILKGQKVPLLNIIYTTAFLQVFIVICITTLITLRKDTEYFFLNTTQTFNGIFKLDDDIDTSLLRTGDIINTLHDKFSIFFNLTKEYSDHFIYPEDILIENTTESAATYHHHHHHHNLIPTAILKFNFKSHYLDQKSMSYELNPTNYSILTSNTSSELISIIQNSDTIHSYFEIESYSFINDVRNLWKWKIDYFVHYTSSNRMLSAITLSYDRIDTSVSWWNKDSTEFMGSVIASFGLCAFSIMALTRFAYKYGFCFMFNKNTMQKMQFRIILPISHLVSLICGLVYLINLSNISDLNDKWTLRLAIAVCAWLSWCMLVFAVSTQGTEYGALFKTLKISFKPIVILIVSLFPIMIGFILFGALIFGTPNGQLMFTSPEVTAKTLYAVWLGDEVLDTFYAAGVGNVIAEIYMYTWGILFIAVIFNVGLAIVESNFFETIPQLEMPEDKPGASLRDLQRIKEAKDKKKNTIDHDDGNERNGDNEESSEEDENSDIEWKLNEVDTFKSEMYIFSDVQQSFEYIPQENNSKESIRLNTVKSIIKTKNVNASTFLYNDSDNKSCDEMEESGLDKQEMMERNKKYTNSFVSHLKHKIINKISQGLIDKNIRGLLNKFPIDSQKDLDLLQNEIGKHYQNYLVNVETQMTQFVSGR